MKLISMVDFVLESISKFNTYESEENLNSIIKYANFLKQPLKLEMFVPCDEDGNILEEPIFHEPNCENEIGNYEKLIEEYYEAKEKVLFDGFYWEGNYAVCMAEDEMIYIDDEFMHNMTIDKLLTTIITDLQLTKSAIKQLVL